jgi:ABC-2 type transport system ATP-binding protein
MNQPILMVENLCKKFGQTVALQGVSFAVHPGEVFGYLGPNGAGKTTTVRILLGLLKPTSGYAELFGQDVQVDSIDIRQRIGVVLEEPGLYERLSAHDNLEYYARLYGLNPKQRQRRIKELLELVSLTNRRHDIVGTFSRGMKQRLAIARALINDPELLFLDEPTAGLDPEGRRDMRDLLLRLVRASNRTIFICSHDLNEIQRLCSRIAILKQGKLLACDSLPNLARQFSSPTMELTIEGVIDPKNIRSALEGRDFVVNYRWDAPTLRVDLTHMDYAPALLKALLMKGVPISQAKRVTRSLEEIYLTLVKEPEIYENTSL